MILSSDLFQDSKPDKMLYSLYHTSYETFRLVEKYIDPGFKYHQGIARVVAEMLYSISNKQVLPYDVTKYVEEVVMMFIRLIMHDPWRDEIAEAGIAIGMIHKTKQKTKKQKQKQKQKQRNKKQKQKKNSHTHTPTPPPPTHTHKTFLQLLEADAFFTFCFWNNSCRTSRQISAGCGLYGRRRSYIQYDITDQCLIFYHNVHHDKNAELWILIFHIIGRIRFKVYEHMKENAKNYLLPWQMNHLCKIGFCLQRYIHCP